MARANESITITLTTLSQTHQIGALLASVCKPPCIIYLQGELGSGKTALVRAMLNAMGFSGNVKSPTYTLVEPYTIGHCHVYHFDLYRLKDPLELNALGISDYVNQDSICIIEWPEKGEDKLPLADVTCKIAYHGTTARQFELIASSALGEKVLQQLRRPIQEMIV